MIPGLHQLLAFGTGAGIQVSGEDLEVAVARGKQLHDKRESLKKRETQREIQRAMSRKRG